MAVIYAAAGLNIIPKLVDVFEGRADIRGAYGGRGSGKSRTFALMTAVRCYMWDLQGREGIILCGRQFMNSLGDSSLEEIKLAIRAHSWLEKAFDVGEKFIKTKSGRIYYSFSGLDRNIDSVKSKSRILLAWIDEAEPVTEDAWIKLVPTLREEDSELWVTWNPESKRAPTHKRFREASYDALVKIVEVNYRDNPWFPHKLERARLKDYDDRPESYSHIWEGDFRTIFVGAYYATQMNAARVEGRIGFFPYDPDLPVHTAWDLGVGDPTALWFFQIGFNQIRIIEYYENVGAGADFYVEYLNSKPYRYGDDFVPHDARVKEWGTGRTRIETLIQLGRKSIRLVPSHSVDDGINAVRQILPICSFNQETAEAGIDCLRQYRTEFDDEKQSFSDRPRHDWTSHGADGFRYLALAYRELVPLEKPKEKPIVKSMNELTIGEFIEAADSEPEIRERV